MRPPADLVDLFRSRGLKVTPQRQAVFEVLYGNEGHPTAEAVHDRIKRTMPTVSLRTVYQTLNDLAELGELQPLDLGTGSTRFDPNVEDHHHLVCTRCRTVRDLYVAPRVTLTEGQLEGFQPATTEIVIRGLCNQCQSASPETTKETTPHA